MKYIFLITIAGLSVLLLMQPKATPETALRGHLPEAISELGRQKLIEIRTEIKDRNDLLPKTSAIFKEMHALRTYAFREEVRAQLMDDLLQDSQSIPLAKQILIDHDFTLREFKGDQAIARVYAIALLKHHAKTAGSSELFEAAQKLAIALAQTGVHRGRGQDLDDLVYSYAKMEGADSLYANLPIVAQQFAINAHTRDPIRNGFFYALKGRLGEEEARERINSAF